MKDLCECSYCACDNNHPSGAEKTPQEKINELKKAILDIGYEVKENKEGEIIVSE
jgi:hypothetical protein